MSEQDNEEQVVGVMKRCDVCERKTMHVDGVCQAHEVVVAKPVDEARAARRAARDAELDQLGGVNADLTVRANTTLWKALALTAPALFLLVFLMARDWAIPVTLAGAVLVTWTMWLAPVTRKWAVTGAALILLYLYGATHVVYGGRDIGAGGAHLCTKSGWTFDDSIVDLDDFKWHEFASGRTPSVKLVRAIGPCLDLR